jgi:hypothetical protein
MISPNVDRAEAIRLINEIAMADVWLALTFSIKDSTFLIHSEMKSDDARTLIAAYALHDQKLLDLIKEKL